MPIGVVVWSMTPRYSRRISQPATGTEYIAGVLFLGLVLMRRFFLARLRSSNWLARMRDDGLLIQFRSYLNYHLPGGDVTVIFIPYQDIRSARLVRERTKIEAQDGTTEETCRLVELELAADLTPL